MDRANAQKPGQAQQYLVDTFMQSGPAAASLCNTLPRIRARTHQPVSQSAHLRFEGLQLKACGVRGRSVLHPQFLLSRLQLPCLTLRLLITPNNHNNYNNCVGWLLRERPRL
jgi:hypothetical protein